ncbi:MAG: FimV/HubP family polar landmark protein, partial [Gammaproteobacteria bacterium]
GLYDQAAELVEKALDVEPGRRDLKLKLLEVFFVWGNKDSFLEAAKALRGDIGSGPDSEWDKVVIMGKQICPDDSLFSGATASAGGVDVDLEAGDSPSLDMAFDIGAASSVDLGLEANDTEDAAEEEEGLGLGDQTLAGLETAIFALPENRDDGTTPDLDADILAASQESPTLGLPDSLSLDPEGTVPGDSSALDTVLESAGEEVTELDLNDLGLDLDADDLPTLSDDDEATEVAADVMSSSGVSDVLDDISLGSSDTATGVALDLDDLVSALGDDETAEIPVEQIVGSDILVGAETDLDVGTTSSQTGLLDPHTMTMTEVGTKLDLARAYVDMGDSDGARAILEEVVAEGDPVQQTEAQGIIDGL